MSYVINDECVNCGACAPICPVQAISENKKINRHEIDPNECVDCGACAETCPVKAISPGK